MAEGLIATRERATEWAQQLFTGLWAGVDPYDGRQVASFAATAVKPLATAQTIVARAAAGSQKQTLAAMGIEIPARVNNPIEVRGAELVLTDRSVVVKQDVEHSTVDYANNDMASVTAADMSTEAVLNRPARTARYLESQGASRDEAAAAAIQRLNLIIEDNLMLAQRLAEAEIIAEATQRGAPIVGHRRIIHPELSRTGVCGLCIAAADRIYIVSELRPIHDRCKCTTAAVTTDFDPADELNKADLKMLYEDSGGTSGAHLKRTRYKIDEHGELGAVLVPRKPYKVRGSDTASPPAPASPESKTDVARRHLPIFEANLRKLQASGLPERSPQIQYHLQQIQRYRAALSA
jgi:hypothetical protein